jgi:putative ABC transport system permease protein
MLTRLLAFARGLARRRIIDVEVDDELQFHLDQESRAHIARGVSPEEARRLAVLSLGGIAQTKEAVRDVRTTRLDAAWRETRLAVRTLRAAPAFTLPAVVVLALGIGGTTAVFSVIDGVLLRPLTFHDPDDIVRVWSSNVERRIAFLSVSPADFEDWQARTSLGQLAAYERPRAMLWRGRGPEPLTAMAVTPGLFRLLGVSPALGRALTTDEAAGTAVISHALWHGRFGGVPNVIGRTIATDDHSWTIVGVMPAGFDVPNAPADVWFPLVTRVATDARFAHSLRVLARTRVAGDVEGVRRDLSAVAAQLARERPAENHGWSVTVRPMFDTVVSPEFRQSVWIIAGAVLFVLVMAGTTVAGLLLARASTRQRELAVRAALGASRGSLVRLLLLESLVLSTVAGVFGVLVAFWGLDLLQEIGASTVPRLEEVSLSTRGFLFAAFTTVTTAAIAGLLPAWKSTASLHEMLRSRGSTSDPGAGRALDVLVVLEVSSAVLLVVGSALLVQTVLNLQGRNLGYEPTGLLAVRTVWSPAVGGESLPARTDAVVMRLSRLPGVTAAAAGSALPFSGQNTGNTFEVEGRKTTAQALPDADYRVVSPGYFQALRVPIKEGRAFGDADDAEPAVVIVSETAARRFWPDESPLGRRLKLGRSEWLTIVGVSGDVRYGALDEPGDRVRPMIYVPHRLMPSTPMTLVLRARDQPAPLAETVRRTLASEASIVVGGIETMSSMLDEASVAQRFAMNLLSAFAAMAVTLAAVGIYGVLAFMIGRRTKEIGVRFALGARPWDVMRMTIGRTLVLASIGVVGGLLVSASLSGVLRNVLFGVSPDDPLTYGLVSIGFLLLAVAASALPTLRALHVDPIGAIRMD